jgi:hypothetical protein
MDIALIGPITTEDIIGRTGSEFIATVRADLGLIVGMCGEPIVAPIEGGDRTGRLTARS